MSSKNNKNESEKIKKYVPVQKENQDPKFPHCKCNEISKEIIEIKGQLKILLELAVQQKVVLSKLLQQHNDNLQLHNKFPLQSVEKIKAMDGEISAENKVAYIKAMRPILNPAGVSKNLKHILSTKVLMAYNVEGVQGKKSLKALSNFYDALIQSRPISDKFPGTADEQLRKAIQLQKRREFKAKSTEKKRRKIDNSSKEPYDQPTDISAADC